MSVLPPLLADLPAKAVILICGANGERLGLLRALYEACCQPNVYAQAYGSLATDWPHTARGPIARQTLHTWLAMYDTLVLDGLLAPTPAPWRRGLLAAMPNAGRQAATLAHAGLEKRRATRLIVGASTVSVEDIERATVYALVTVGRVEILLHPKAQHRGIYTPGGPV